MRLNTEQAAAILTQMHKDTGNPGLFPRTANIADEYINHYIDITPDNLDYICTTLAPASDGKAMTISDLVKTGMIAVVIAPADASQPSQIVTVRENQVALKDGKYPMFNGTDANAPIRSAATVILDRSPRYKLMWDLNRIAEVALVDAFEAANYGIGAQASKQSVKPAVASESRIA